MINMLRTTKLYIMLYILRFFYNMRLYNLKLSLFTILVSFLLCMSACSQKTTIHGYSFGDLGQVKEKISKIKVGMDNELDVLALLGSPTTISNFGPDTFFYIQRKTSSKLFFDPKLIYQNILEITFDDNHIINSIKEYQMKDSKNIKYDDGKVEFKGNELGIVEQFSKNIGRFNSKKAD